MREEFLQYIWANALFRCSDFVSCSGKKIQILNVGTWNRDAGPDFFNARLRIENIEFAGNIEIHLKNSDWYRHGHHVDAAYNNVLLSVVKEADGNIYNSAGQEVETVVLEYAENLYEEYLFMQRAVHQPGCRQNLKMIDKEWFDMTLEALAIERLERKCGDIRNILEQTQDDWQECFYRLLCKYWAGNVNSDPFYQLALRLPYKVLLKHSDKPEQQEALLLGCAGLLEEETGNDEYVNSLRDEFHYLQSKYGLTVLSAEQWKFMRIRPDAFPTVRIALLASFFREFPDLVGKVTEAQNLWEIFDALEVKASSYWDTHYRFGQTSFVHPKKMGQSLKNIVVINVVVPFLFLYGKYQANEKYCDRAMGWLEQLSAEKNYIITDWENCGFHFNSALQTQALIQLRKEYCDKHRCLQCKLGREVLKKMSI